MAESVLTRIFTDIIKSCKLTFSRTMFCCYSSPPAPSGDVEENSIKVSIKIKLVCFQAK